MPALPRALLLCAVLLLAPGCRKIADTFFVVGLNSEELCKTERNVTFSASTPGPATVEKTVRFPLGQLGQDLPEGRLETELRLRLFELNVTGGEVDLGGIEYAKVSLRRQGSGEVIRTLLEYRRPAQVFSPTQLSLRGVEPASVPQLAREESVELVFEATGDLPQQEWTADIQACADMQAEVHSFHLIF
jgi:hypothetical protein